MADTKDDGLPEAGYVRQADLVGAKERGPDKPARRGLIPFSATTLWRKVNSKEFPAPVKLSDNVTAWRVEDVRQWLASRS
jgi:prophage regulatory protein